MPDLTIKKTTLLVVLFLIAYLFVDFVPFAGLTIVLFLYLVVNRRPSMAIFRAAGIPELLAIFMIAASSTLAISPYPFSAWNTVKDVYFFIAPVLLLVSGLIFLKCGSDFTRVYVTAIYVLSMASVISFSDFLFGVGITNFSLETRYTYGLDSTASTLALMLILSLRPTLSSLLRSSKLTLLLLLNLFLVIASLSRVSIAIALVSLIFVYSQSKLVRSAVVAVVLLLTVAPWLQISQGSTPVNSGSPSFFDKFWSSLDELQLSDYSSMEDINANWRGYEAYLGIQAVENAGGVAPLVGVGFGSFVVGPFVGKLENIPFFHNGFVTIYLKAGSLGLIAFALFAIKLYRRAMSASRAARVTGDPRIARAALVIFLLTNSILLKTLVTHGVYYAKTTFDLFFIGMAIHGLHVARRSPRSFSQQDEQSTN